MLSILLTSLIIEDSAAIGGLCPKGGGSLVFFVQNPGKSSESIGFRFGLEDNSIAAWLEGTCLWICRALPWGLYALKQVPPVLHRGTLVWTLVDFHEQSIVHSRPSMQNNMCQIFFGLGHITHLQTLEFSFLPGCEGSWYHFFLNHFFETPWIEVSNLALIWSLHKETILYAPDEQLTKRCQVNQVN